MVFTVRSPRSGGIHKIQLHEAFFSERFQPVKIVIPRDANPSGFVYLAADGIIVAKNLFLPFPVKLWIFLLKKRRFMIRYWDIEKTTGEQYS